MVQKLELQVVLLIYWKKYDHYMFLMCRASFAYRIPERFVVAEYVWLSHIAEHGSTRYGC